MQRSIKIRVIKESSRKITIYLESTNRKMLVPKEKFLKNVKSGLYEITNDYEVDLSEIE